VEVLELYKNHLIPEDKHESKGAKKVRAIN
jgi:hypothetical protein